MRLRFNRQIILQCRRFSPLDLVANAVIVSQAVISISDQNPHKKVENQLNLGPNPSETIQVPIQVICAVKNCKIIATQASSLRP
jgi:hypothetical protein